MKEIIRFWLLNRVIKNTTLSAEIYQMLYKNKTFVRPVELTPIREVYFEPIAPVMSSVPSNYSPTISTSSNRRKELSSALAELKSKPLKTKQDKESIGMLEAALKNVN